MIKESIDNIQKQISFYSEKYNNQNIKLVAVSKTFPHDKIEEAFCANIFDFGENYVQELISKKEKLSHLNINWHFIGHLQTNKVKLIAPFIYLIHSVDSIKLAHEVDCRAKEFNRKIKILVEVNTSREATKFGVEPNYTLNFLSEINNLENLEVEGLMTIGPFTDDKQESRRAFKKLKELLNQANKLKITKKPLTQLSMGMTHDFPIAIEEGATILRIGTAIFGNRTKKNV